MVQEVSNYRQPDKDKCRRMSLPGSLIPIQLSQPTPPQRSYSLDDISHTPSTAPITIPLLANFLNTPHIRAHMFDTGRTVGELLNVIEELVDAQVSARESGRDGWARELETAVRDFEELIVSGHEYSSSTKSIGHTVTLQICEEIMILTDGSLKGDLSCVEEVVFVRRLVRTRFLNAILPNIQAEENRGFISYHKRDYRESSRCAGRYTSILGPVFSPTPPSLSGDQPRLLYWPSQTVFNAGIFSSLVYIEEIPDMCQERRVCIIDFSYPVPQASGSCPICFEELRTAVRPLACNHIFCADCLHEWAETLYGENDKTIPNCPCCRQDLKTEGYPHTFWAIGRDETGLRRTIKVLNWYQNFLDRSKWSGHWGLEYKWAEAEVEAYVNEIEKRGLMSLEKVLKMREE
ncbi:hypothetical protein P154DRAFT_587753 [Amniculicola lignicola CBS 123094]|uniref:RING-type domain-containing protein n=1 Tax=Amniculicola lignicola CBS 123094 TaxID=1392246 RepID=A0A6A5VYW9_9PLEO|nr:hypothetical protein P154DRAFT_587753 [Amniculicola lignicola CBS 123094]